MNKINKKNFLAIVLLLNISFLKGMISQDASFYLKKGIHYELFSLLQDVKTDNITKIEKILTQANKEGDAREILNQLFNIKIDVIPAFYGYQGEYAIKGTLLFSFLYNSAKNLKSSNPKLQSSYENLFQEKLKILLNFGADPNMKIVIISGLVNPYESNPYKETENTIKQAAYNMLYSVFRKKKLAKILDEILNVFNKKTVDYEKATNYIKEQFSKIESKLLEIQERLTNNDVGEVELYRLQRDCGEILTDQILMDLLLDKNIPLELKNKYIELQDRVNMVRFSF